MIIATLTAIFLILTGGGGFWLSDELRDIRKDVKIVVEDEQRRKMALQVVDGLRKAGDQQGKIVNRMVKELSAEMEQHGGSSDRIIEIFDDYDDLAESFHASMVLERARLKKYVSREEWARLFPEDG